MKEDNEDKKSSSSIQKESKIKNDRREIELDASLASETLFHNLKKVFWIDFLLRCLCSCSSLNKFNEIHRIL